MTITQGISQRSLRELTCALCAVSASENKLESKRMSKPGVRGLAMSQCNRTGSLACSIVLDSCHPPDVPPVKTICTRRSAGRVLTCHTLFDIAFFLFEATSTNHVPEWSCISMSQLASLSVCHVLANRIRVGARVGPIFVLCLYRESLDYQRKQPRPTDSKLHTRSTARGAFCRLLTEAQAHAVPKSIVGALLFRPRP